MDDGWRRDGGWMEEGWKIITKISVSEYLITNKNIAVPKYLNSPG